MGVPTKYMDSYLHPNQDGKTRSLEATRTDYDRKWLGL